jgi:flagellar basal-body rod protein FlgG
MLSGISTSAGALRAEQLRMDVTAHNVANSDTPGHREEQVSLADTAPGVAAVDAGPSPEQGALEQTGGPLDLAIQGGGFFQVRRPDGQLALTRDGTFTTDPVGRVMTMSGAELMPPLRIPPGTDLSAVNVASDGAVTANAVALGSVSIVDVPAPRGLMPAGSNLYLSTISSGAPVPAPAGRVAQGYVELSNTNMLGATVDMIAIEHSFAANVRAIHAQDEMLRSVLGLASHDDDR